MRTTLKASLTAIMLTSVAAVPLATATTFLTADAAYAKSEKAKGGSKGKGADKALVKGKSGDRSASRGGHGGLDKFFGKLTGKDKKTTSKKGKGAPKKAAVAAATVETCEGEEGCTPELRTLHPSELGKMNGALNANENAILAHIRNGNMSNGPVGLMAGYAYYSAGTVEARELLASGTAQEYLAYQDALAQAGGATSIEGYDAWVDAQLALPEEERDPNLATIMLDVEGAQAKLGTGEFEDLGGYDAYDAIYNPDGTLKDGAEANEELKAAYDSLGTYDAKTAEAVDKAGEDVVAYDDALAALYESWNKGGADSENADELKAMLDARVGEYTGVQALYEEMNPPEEDPDSLDLSECEEGAEGCDPLEEDLAAAE